jgi:hypothetical protein
MNNQQKIKELQEQIKALKAQELSFNWNDAQVICELNGYRWLLGPEADDEMNWADAKNWCQSVGGELPPRAVLLMCYINEDIAPSFKTSWYWSYDGLNATGAWTQSFTSGFQYFDTKYTINSVRAVRKCPI